MGLLLNQAILFYFDFLPTRAIIGIVIQNHLRIEFVDKNENDPNHFSLSNRNRI
jgi:hypothetical protein